MPTQKAVKHSWEVGQWLVCPCFPHWFGCIVGVTSTHCQVKWLGSKKPVDQYDIRTLSAHYQPVTEEFVLKATLACGHD